ncbi:hypothetical protein MMC13_005189 [Lambiella insularis]|nr:hypothetical protein [Lambiella insularis]
MDEAVPVVPAVPLAERLERIKSPRLQNQRQTAVVLSAIEDTLRTQNHEFTATAYFAALLALLSQTISSSNDLVNKDLATSVVYLLDLITAYVPRPILRSKFSQILTSLAPALTHQDADAPLLRSSIGCLEALLVAQDNGAWALPQTQIGPRRAVAGLLLLAVDHRPKVRKRAHEALLKVLKSPPPSPSLDHPAADMCAETALHNLSDLAQVAGKKHKGRGPVSEEHHPSLIHALQLVKSIAAASGGWPAKKIDSLCECLLSISKSSNEYLSMGVFEIFEIIFEGMAGELASSKLPRLMEVISDLRPSQNDSQLLPPWIAILSRGYDVSAQINPEETFHKLPEVFDLISGFLASMSHNIRISASECLISFTATCIPITAILEPSIYDERVLEKLSKAAINLLNVKYQAAWMEVFNVLSALFDALKWRASPLLKEIVKTIGELRTNDSFTGKKEVDTVLGHAIEAMGPEAVIDTLPLNLLNPNSGLPGRAWLLPIFREHVINTNLMHFRSEFVPLSENVYQKVVDNGAMEKTIEIKIFETLVQQIWGLLPGYCTLPLDLTVAFDQTFAELLANVLYKQTDLRVDVCKALQLLVESNKETLAIDGMEEDLILQRRITKVEAQQNIDHLAMFAGNLLAVLFNVYSQTLPQFRGYILQCINAYLSITTEKELLETFTRVTSMLEAALTESTAQTQADKQKQKLPANSMPPTSHTLMDLVITLSIYLPRSSFPTLFSLAALILPQSSDPQLQKKAYKLLPRLATSPTGVLALQDRNSDLQQLLLRCASSASAPSRRDRLAAIAVVTSYLPPTSLHFIPSILSEVVISAKEVNEKARSAAFDLLVLMGRKMSAGGLIAQSQMPHMPADAPNAEASLEEFFTMVSAGLAGSTPHMISASITALTRILYEFHAELSERVMEDLVSTMAIFLDSNNREIVRSVLGFIKVAVVSLPENIVRPRLEALVPNLMGWSHEHKARFRAKVKHILERMMRRFGYEAVDKWCPENDKKLIHNIRKSRERNKRKKEVVGDTGDNDTEDKVTKRKSRFESEFDEAIYGSGSEAGGSDRSEDADESDNDISNRRKGAKAYIVEDEDEPLDLLDRKALGSISTTKPIRFKSASANGTARKKAKTDLDGKLIFGDDDDDEMLIDFDKKGNSVKVSGREEPGDGTLEGGINAYVDAIRGRDAVQRGRGGRLKFSNRKEKADEMDVDDDTELQREVKKSKDSRGLNRLRSLGRGRGDAKGGGGARGARGAREQRKSFSGAKMGGGRVSKSVPRGGSKGGGRSGGLRGRR